MAILVFPATPAYQVNLVIQVSAGSPAYLASPAYRAPQGGLDILATQASQGLAA